MPQPPMFARRSARYGVRVRPLGPGLVASCAAALLVAATTSLAQQRSTPVERLPASVLEVTPPSTRVTGEPGQMRVSKSGCSTSPAALNSALRQRIVDIATQEWAFFGQHVIDETAVPPSPRPPQTPATTRPPTSGRGRFGRVSADEAARVASSIGGYWTVTAEAAWILDQQNDAWNGRSGIAAGWRNPWSAVFVSWVMCESGLSDTTVFRRAIAHHSYVDQAIRARDGAAPQAAFVAYDAGERPVEPGDLLCFGRRPAYSTLSERRRQMGEGARTHCDIVVKIDTARSRILTIGGNVRGTVSLKVLPADRRRDGSLRPLHIPDEELDDNPYRGVRPIFAHLKLRAGATAASALDRSPTIKTLACAATAASAVQPPIRQLLDPPTDGC